MRQIMRTWRDGMSAKLLKYEREGLYLSSD